MWLFDMNQESDGHLNPLRAGSLSQPVARERGSGAGCAAALREQGQPPMQARHCSALQGGDAARQARVRWASPGPHLLEFKQS